MVVSPPARAGLALAALAACGGDAPGVRLAPVGDGPCGRPTDARSLLVTPLGDFRAERRPIALDAPVALADLPASTRQLAVEVIGEGGQVLAQGKTVPFDFAALADGDTLGVAMGPPDDACPAGTMATSRDRPLVAPVGGGVLVAGGYAPTPLATAEWFDPATDTFRNVALPAGFGGVRGLAGAALVPLADGTVALVGGPSPGFAIYDPEDGFRPAVLVSQVRAHAAAVAIDDHRVLLLGGCGSLRDDGTCEAGSARADSRILHVGGATPGVIEDGPLLVAERVDSQVFLEREPDGRRTVVLVGGVDGAGAPQTSAERIDLESGAVTILPGAGGAAARNDAGTIITAFGADGTAPRGETAALVPGVDVIRALPTLAPRAGAVLATQEDGLVLALGGGPALRFLPAASSWSVVDAAALPVFGGGHAVLRLDDGSLFVVGGRVAGTAQAAAWRFRPRLVGRFTGSLTVVPGDDESDPPLSPLDPSLVTVAPVWRLRGAGADPSHAVVGGPQGGTLRVDLGARVPSEGIAVVLGQVGPADFHQIVLIPGVEASLERRVAGAATTLCRGQAVPAAGPTSITLDLRGGEARVAMNGQVLLTCDVDGLPAGRVGVGALGSGEVDVLTIAVTR